MEKGSILTQSTWARDSFKPRDTFQTPEFLNAFNGRSSAWGQAEAWAAGPKESVKMRISLEGRRARQSNSCYSLEEERQRRTTDLEVHVWINFQVMLCLIPVLELLRASPGLQKEGLRIPREYLTRHQKVGWTTLALLYIPSTHRL